MLKLSETILEDFHQLWEGLAVVVKSLDRRVPAEWVAKEVRVKTKVDYDPEVFSIADDHVILHFRSENDRYLMKCGGPWLVASQLLAMEAWVPDFIPSRRAIQRAVVWLRLPSLSLEHWVSMAIMAIAVQAGRLLSIDDFTNLLRKTGYARVRVEIDAGKPICPGVLIRGKKGEF